MFRLDTKACIAGGNRKATQTQARRLQQWLKQWLGLNVRMSSAASARKGSIRLRLVKSLKNAPAGQEEAYRICVRPHEIDVEATHARGLFYAVESLQGLLRRDSGAWSLPCGELIDWPEFSWRGLLIDPARKFIPVPEVKTIIDMLAHSKMNVLHVHFTDNELFSIESKQEPKLNERLYQSIAYPRVFKGLAYASLAELQAVEDAYAGVYTAADIKDLNEYAAARNVEILPEISMPSHSAPVIRAFPELHCEVHRKGDCASETVMCIGNERTYDVIASLLDEMVPLFPGRYVHIGSDEIDCRDILWSGLMVYAQRWSVCETCRARMKKEGLKNVYELFYYFVKRVHKMLAAHGKQTMMWNDFINIAKPHQVPKDVLIQYWRIAMKRRGPVSGCSFAKFLKSGFQVVNSEAWNTYIDAEVLLKEHKLARWNPTTFPPCPAELKKQIVGSEMSAWSHWEHYARTLPPGIAMYADRVWNKQPIADLPAFSRSVARHLFGPQFPADKTDVLQRFGSILSPRKDDARVYAPEGMTMPGQAVKTPAECRQLEADLRRLRRRPKLMHKEFIGELLHNGEALRNQMKQT